MGDKDRFEVEPTRNTSVYENIQYLSDLPVNVNVTSVRYSAYHWHYDFEFIAVLKGAIEVGYTLYGPDELTLSAGDVILINSKAIHSVKGDDNICLCIQFSPELLGSVQGDMKYRFLLNSASREYASELPKEHFMELAARIGIAARQGTPDALFRKKAWLNMLLADLVGGKVLYEMWSIPTTTERDAELAVSISTFVDQNLADEDLPQAVYKQFGLSEKRAYRLLKDVVGVTLKEMIDTARVERACMLLRDSSIPLQVISDRCGYSGETTFYRRFRSALGMTPGQYRAGVRTSTVNNEIQDYLSVDESEIDLLLGKWSGERV